MGAEARAIEQVSFFELDRLFNRAAKALHRKQQRKRRKERQQGGVSPSRSRSPAGAEKRLLGRGGKAVAAGFGGFTGSVEKVEKTCVVTGVPDTADERTLFKFFSKCGKLSDVRIVKNRQEGSTGTVIVEFVDEASVTKACELTGPASEICSVAVTVKRADAQLQKAGPPAPKRIMTRQEFTQQVLSGLKTGAQESGPNMRKLHIKNLRSVVTEDDMRGIFKPFGDFEEFSMGTQECWIVFKNANDAQDAMSSMQGFQLVGQELQIVLAAFVAPIIPVITHVVPKKPLEKMDIAKDTDFGGGDGGEDVTGKTPAQARVELMQKLMTSHADKGVPMVVGTSAPSALGATPTAMPSAAAVPPTPKPGGAMSRTLLLQNMFTPTAVDLSKDPRFYDEIREDTTDECAKFGKVLHCTVDPRGSTGLIYVLYETAAMRQAAEMSLNGRWFEGKKILGMGIDDSIWQALAAQAQAGA